MFCCSRPSRSSRCFDCSMSFRENGAPTIGHVLRYSIECADEELPFGLKVSKLKDEGELPLR